MKTLSITVCIPVFNEAQNLEGLFKSLSSSDIHQFNYEILLCDSASSDGINTIVTKWEKSLNLRVITTSGANASRNLNAGINEARGEVFLRLDARSGVSKDYFTVGLQLLSDNRNKYCAIGPSVEVFSNKSGIESECMAAFYKSPLLMGPSEYKRSYFYQNFEGVVGTIYLGFFWLADLKAIDGFNTAMDRKQDIDILSRLVAHTGKRLFCSARCMAQYKLKHDSLREIGFRAFVQGKFMSLDIKNVRVAHFFPILALFICGLLLFNYPATLIIAVVLYLFFVGVAGFFERRQLSSIPYAIITFPFVHFSYIVGNLVGFYIKLNSKFQGLLRW